MIIVPFVFAAACLLATAWAVRHKLRAGSRTAVRGSAFLLLTTLGSCYLAAFLSISLGPYYDDNGWPEFIELRHRWAWASITGRIPAIFFVPTVFAMRGIWRAWRAHR